MLTALGRPEDVLLGFDAGADDYLPKPFELKILIARLRGLLRRGEWLRKSEQRAEDGPRRSVERRAADGPVRRDSFAFAGKTLDFSSLELLVGKDRYRLTLMETQLLRYLISNADKVVSRKQILEDVWGLH